LAGSKAPIEDSAHRFGRRGDLTQIWAAVSDARKAPQAAAFTDDSSPSSFRLAV